MDRTPITSRGTIGRALGLLAACAVTIAASVAISAAVIHTKSLPSATTDLVYVNRVLAPHVATTVDADCPPSKVATGGGSYTVDLKGKLAVLDSFPHTRRSINPPHAQDVIGWHVVFLNNAVYPLKAGAVVACLDRRSTGMLGARSQSSPARPTPRDHRVGLIFYL